MSEKKVLCVPKDVLFALVPDFENEIEELEQDQVVPLLKDAGPIFIPRSQAETDENYLQVIPYVTVASATDHKLLAYKRQGGGEQRLEGKWSVGFGGHIDDTDCFDQDHIPLTNVLCFAAYREIFEELCFKDDWQFATLPGLKIIGVVYTGNFRDAGPVDRVHVGVSMVLPVVDTTWVKPRQETGTAVEYAWLSENELFDRYGEFELWSRCCLPGYTREHETIQPEAATLATEDTE